MWTTWAAIITLLAVNDRTQQNGMRDSSSFMARLGHRLLSSRHRPTRTARPTLAHDRGSKADSLYMTEDAFAKATGAKDKHPVQIDGATHIETYWVPRHVDSATSELTKFFARTIGA